MTKEFMETRIKEQAEYIAKVSLSVLSKKRKLEIIKSAFGQLKYFTNKLNGIKKETKWIKNL